MGTLKRFSALVLIISLVVSAPPPLNAATTDTFRDEFNNISYSGDDGVGASWAGAWWESEAVQDPTQDDITVESDGAEDYVLRFDNSAGVYAERTADLSAYDTATLSFDYRRMSTDPSFSFKVWASANGQAGPFTEIFAISSGDDAFYVGSGILDLTAQRSATTTIRFSHELGDLGAGMDFYVDNVEISASAANTAPVAIDDSTATGSDMAVNVDVLDNDSDPDLDALAVDSVSQGANGSVVNNATDVTYTPNVGWSGIDTFTYTVTDGNGGFDTATVTVTISVVNGDPVAVDDPDVAVDPVDYMVRRALSRSLDVLFNDTDPEGDPLTVISAGPGANGGTVTVAGDGLSVSYAPPGPSYVGPDTFTYTISDGNGGTASGSVDVVVTDKLADLWIGSIYTDPVVPSQGSPFDLVVVSRNVGPDPAANAEVTLQLTPTLTYVSGSAENGACSEIPPGSGTIVCTLGNPPGDSLPRVVTVTVVASSPGPHTVTAAIGSDDIDPEPANNLSQLIFGTTNSAPDAVDDSDSTAEDTAVTVDVLGNDSDTDLDPLSVSVVTQGLNGSVVNNGTSVTYDPDPDWNGMDTFTYTVSDGNGGFATGTVTVTVTPANDDPAAVDDTELIPEDSSSTFPVLGNDSDPDGHPLTITGVIDGSNGTVTNNGTDVTYTPAPDWSGTDTFIYTISDGNGGSASAFVNVTVTPVNDNPQGQPDAASTPEETAVEIEVLANDSDVDSSALTVTAVAGGTHGTVSTDGITLTYTPDLNWNGIDTFTYRVSDDLGGWSETIVTVTVTPVNDNPVAVDDLSTTPRDTPVYIWVLDNDTDADPDTLSVSGFTNGAHGTVANHSIKVTYTPAAGWTGVDTFTYTVSDGNGGFDSGTVTVTVTAGPNQPPAANDDSMVTDEDVALTISVLANDSDPDGDAITVSAVNEGAHGAVTKTATSITYTPDEEWSGIDSFSYSITDGHGGSATAAVVITVKPVNDPPLARDDYKGTPQATAVSIPVLVNDVDVDGDPLAVAGVSPGSHGVTTTDGRSVTYSPDPGWTGTDFFTYTVTDGHGGSDSATVAVAVGIANRPPTITVKGDTSVREDEPLALEVSVGDPDGDDVSITTSGRPGWASTVDHGNGTATIFGIPGFDADPSNEIIISASDGTVTTRTTVLIEVIDVNRPPLIGPITFSGVHEDGSFSFTISSSDPDGDLLAISTNGLPSWATLTDNGDGRATISSPGVPHDALGSFSVVVSVTDGQTTVTSSVERLISDLRNSLPPELTHQAFDIEGVDTLVSTSLRPRVATPNSLNLHLTPREGLMVAFGSAVETLKNQILPALALGLVMAWMLMIGVGRPKEDAEPGTA